MSHTQCQNCSKMCKTKLDNIEDNGATTLNSYLHTLLKQILLDSFVIAFTCRFFDKRAARETGAQQAE